MTDPMHARIERDFTNHPPQRESTVEAFEQIRVLAKAFAHGIVDLCPPGREQSLALTYAEQASMFAIAAIAREGH